MARDNLAILWLLATHAGFIIALTLILGAPPYDPRKADQRRKSLFDLPPELRARVYEFALVRQRNLRFCSDCRFGVRLNNTRVLPSILATCKTIHREATPILYGANTFSFKNPHDATRFLALFVRSIDLIRKLEILDAEYHEAAGDYSAYLPAFKFAISLNSPGVFQYEVLWEIAMGFQELYEEGNREFGKQEVWARVESRMDQRQHVLPSMGRTIEKLLLASTRSGVQKLLA